MTALAKYDTSNLVKIFEDLDKYSIGLDNWFDKVSTITYPQSNYPPYNLLKVSDTCYKLEIAASGFKSSELTVYTENNRLIVEAEKSCKEEKEYIYRSLSHRNFKRIWSLSEDVRVKSVNFEDGLLLIQLEKIISEHQKKKVFF